MKNTDES